MPDAPLPRIVVAGLGPGDDSFVTAAVAAAVDRIPHRYLRTSRHPSAAVIGEATTFDDMYEAADTFDDLYAAIADRLVAAATEHGEILYAVPGSPLVLERTVRHLLGDQRVRCEVLPAVSFLDVAYARLGVDPVESGIRLIDGHVFADAAAGYGGPMLVAHCHANWVLSDIKLAVENASGDEDVVILQRLGTADERIVHTTWAELDRTVEADHLTSIYVPGLGQTVAGELLGFTEVVRRLRAECPWDREQTHASLARYAVEETYELVDAIQRLGPDGEGDDELIGELGDVLLQVVLHSAIAEEAGRFTLGEVAQTISEKMIRRHPHVFGDTVVESIDELHDNWAAIKAAERGADRAGPGSALDGLKPSLPTLTYAERLLARSSAAGASPRPPTGRLAELAAAVADLPTDDPAATGDRPDAGRLGDLLLAVVDVCQRAGVDADLALRAATSAFADRHRRLEAAAAQAGVDLATCPADVLALLRATTDRDGD